MDDLFLFLFLLSLLGLIAGLSNPKYTKLDSRKKVLKIFGAATLVFFILTGAFAEPTEQKDTTTKVTSSTEYATEAEKEQNNKEFMSIEENDLTISTTTSSQTDTKTDTDSTTSPIALLSATVTRVVDGDTAYVKLSDGKEEKVRFIGVDTPESTTQKEPYGAEASTYTKSKLDGKTIYLEIDAGERDKYGRLLAYIWLSKPSEINDSEIRSKMFNSMLLTDGYAQVMTIQPNSKYADKFVVYQGEAREKDLGLWALSTSSSSGSSSSSGGTSSGSSVSSGSSLGSTTVSTPSPTPAPSENNSLTVYVTNTGEKYHSDGCQYLRKSKIPISLENAKASYDPCSKCSPPR